MIRLHELCVRTQDGRLLVGPLSLETGGTGRLALVGESGSGKTSLLAALARVSPHVVSGEAVFDVPAAQVRLAVQEPAAAFTPLRRLGSQLRDGKGAAAAAHVPDLLVRLGLDAAVLDRYPHEVSVGMLKRFLLACVLVARPDVALFDEPTSGLDPSLRWTVMHVLTQETRALVVATHDQDLVRSGFADQVLVMAGGTVPTAGPLNQLSTACSTRRRPTRPTRPARPTNAPLLLSARSATVHFPGSPAAALWRFSCELHAGDVLAAVGESGAGKSTLLAAVAGLVPLAEGTVAVAGMPVAGTGRGLRDVRRCLGFVHQSPRAALDPLRPALDQVAEPLIHLDGPGRAEARKLAAEQLAALGIDEARQRRRPHELSGGECQRVGVARALVRHPRLLLADEPTAALDAAVGEAILAELARAVHGATAADQDRAGATPPARAAPVPEKDAARFERPAMVYVTHRLREAESLATQVAVLLKGICVEHIAAFSSWDQVVHPYSRYLVAALTGPVPPFAAPATGCPFAPACAQAAEACRTAVPDEVEISAGHRVRCVRVAAGPQPATA